MPLIKKGKAHRTYTHRLTPRLFFHIPLHPRVSPHRCRSFRGRWHQPAVWVGVDGRIKRKENHGESQWSLIPLARFSFLPSPMPFRIVHLLTVEGPATAALFLSGLNATINPAMRPIVAKATKSARSAFFLCGAEQREGGRTMRSIPASSPRGRLSRFSFRLPSASPRAPPTQATRPAPPKYLPITPLPPGLSGLGPLFSHSAQGSGA